LISHDRTADGLSYIPNGNILMGITIKLTL